MFNTTGSQKGRGKKSDFGKYFLIIVPLVLSFSNAWAQSGAWTKKADMPTGRVIISACVVNDKIYVIGGMNSSYVNFAVNEVYDPSTNSWEVKAPMQTPRAFISTVAVNGIIYAIGGGWPNVTNKVEAYDPVNDIWTPKNNMLSPRFGASACVVDGIIYNIGGNHFGSECETYDPSTDIWTKKTDIPETEGGIMVTSYSGLVYAFGGGYEISFSTVYAYDSITDTWTKKTDMPTSRATLQTCFIDGKIYAIGGYKSVRGDILEDIEVYDPVSDSWIKKTDMPFKRTMFGGAVVNGKIYVIGGTSDWGESVGKEVWEYDPAYVVPVELASFTGDVADGKVILEWRTATELNNYGFEIQRKYGSYDFVTIGSVRGNGTTTSLNQYSYVDKLIDPGKYFYRFKQIDFNGTFEYSNVIEVEVRTLDNFTLEQNYPNPFNPITTIGYVLQEKTNAKLTLLNTIGEEIAVLVNEVQDKGYHKVEFDGSRLTSGVYFYQLKAGNFIETKKMILLR